MTTQAANKASAEPFSVVCTIFPEYDWVKKILGDHADNVELTYLLDSGVDLHSYQPTADDMMKISTCDLFVYVGGESDEWVEDALAGAANTDMKVINLMDVLGDSAKVEELKEGMQEIEHEHEHKHSKEVSTFEDDEVKDRPLSDWEGDWQSAYPLVLDGSLDEAWEHKSEDGSMTAEEYKDYYTKGYNSFQTLVDASSVKALVFGDRFPFRYFVDDYGLDYYAAFIGCSAETEASFKTIAFLADKVKELDCKTIFTLENSSKDIAESIINNSGKTVDIAELNSLQSISKNDIAGGVSYISLMQKNYDVLAGVLK